LVNYFINFPNATSPVMGMDKCYILNHMFFRYVQFQIFAHDIQIVNEFCFKWKSVSPNVCWNIVFVENKKSQTLETVTDIKKQPVLIW